MSLSRREVLKLGLVGGLGVGILGWPVLSWLSEAPPDFETPFLDYLKPLASFVDSERIQRAANDPEFARRVDFELNKNRLNFLIFIEGETYEPPITEKRRIGSQTLISINTEIGTLDKISWTHDLRAPEVERYLKKRGRHDGKAKRIDETYHLGGFELMRQTVESATGFVVDFQLASDDSVIVGLVDDVANGIEVQNPKGFKANPIRFQEAEYPERDFIAGEKLMDGIAALQYIKSVPVGDLDPVIEHNPRKYRVMEALKSKIFQPLNIVRLLYFLREQIDNGSIQIDEPLYRAMFRGENIGAIPELIRYFRKGGSISNLVPRRGKEIYLVDMGSGDGGMRWVNADASMNPITRSDIERGVYPEGLGMEVPSGDSSFLANPYANNLVNDYWQPLRRRVKELSSSTSQVE